MSDLRSRLHALRRQAGNGSAAQLGGARRANPVDGASGIRERPGRLGVASRRVAALADRPSDQQLAELLGGRCLHHGLIAVERAIRAGTPHGRFRIDPCAATDAVRYFSGSDPAADEPIAFLDTETTGLAGGTGTVVFLIGLARFAGGVLNVVQYFLTRLAGERALLEAAGRWVGSAAGVVTFNGKSFDCPLLATRCRLAGVPDPFPGLTHIDLLHATRRAYAKRWPNCRLATAEAHLLGLQRNGDLSGADVPAAWFAWIRHGATRDLPRILAHNRSDLLSLAALLPALRRCHDDPVAWNASALLRARAQGDDVDEHAALDYLRANRGLLDEQEKLALARIARRRSDRKLAVEIWEELALTGCVEATERLAKHHEHVTHEVERALELTRALIRRQPWAERHHYREKRLLRTLEVASRRTGHH